MKITILIFILLILLGCKSQSKDVEPWLEGNHAHFEIPDVEIFKSYRKQFGQRNIHEGEIQVYFISWSTGERRILFKKMSMEIEYPIERTLWENSYIPNPDSNKTGYLGRWARESDSVRPLTFKRYVIKDTKVIYDSLLSMGLDTMVSPSNDKWDLHEGRLFIVESFIEGHFNMFQFSLTHISSDWRFRWIHDLIMSIDPGYMTSPGLKVNWKTGEMDPRFRK
jgi:hypothetical protein